MSDKLVSNAQFLSFVRDGGYEKQEYWSSEGWNWATGQIEKFPKFWIKKEKDDFALRLTFSEMKDLPWDWPVEINCLEASAYCRWLSAKLGQAVRLPTEDEYYSMLKYAGYDETTAFNIGARYTSPTPVDKH